MMSAAHSRDRRRGSRAEARVFELCWRLYSREETDLLDAGVPVAAIEREIGDVNYGVIRKILDRLANRGVLVRLDGANPDTFRSRSSYAPAALYDGGEQR